MSQLKTKRSKSAHPPHLCSILLSMDWTMPACMGEGELSSSTHSSANHFWKTPLHTPRNNVLLFVWSLLHSVKLIQKTITTWVLFWPALNWFLMLLLFAFFVFLLLFGLWKINESQSVFLLAIKTSPTESKLKSLCHLFTPSTSLDFFSASPVA